MPLVSKIFEKSIHFQTDGYLNKKKLIYMYQSGFRLNHSTDNHTGMILADLQKAFDTLDHGVLLEKIKNFGFPRFVINWVESYLKQKILVCIGNAFSETETLKNGLPQGSILGPLLFLFYVYDHP